MPSFQYVCPSNNTMVTSPLVRFFVSIKLEYFQCILGRREFIFSLFGNRCAFVFLKQTLLKRKSKCLDESICLYKPLKSAAKSSNLHSLIYTFIIYQFLPFQTKGNVHIFYEFHIKIFNIQCFYSIKRFEPKFPMLFCQMHIFFSNISRDPKPTQ